MSRQPTQRTLFEQLRTGSEVMRTSELKASDTLARRNTEALIAAAAARDQAAAARAAADAAVAATLSVTDAAQTASDGAAAATAAAAAATSATSAATAVLAQLERTAVRTLTTTGDAAPPSDGSWTNALGLAISGAWEGLASVVRVAIPVSGRGGPASSPYSRRQNFELRLNGTAVAVRTMSTPSTELMTLTYAHPDPHGPGSSTYELWWNGGTDGFVDAGSSGGTAFPVNRTMTVTVLPA